MVIKVVITWKLMTEKPGNAFDWVRVKFKLGIVAS